MKLRVLTPAPLLSIVLTLSPHPQARERLEGHKDSAAGILSGLIDESGIPAAKVRFKEILLFRDTEYDFDEVEFLSLGNRLLHSGRIVEALEVFKMGADVFPKSQEIHLGLGTAHRLLGNHEEDRKSVGRAHELRDEEMLAAFLRERKNELPETADEVIARYLEAIGGKDKVREIQTLVITYSALDAIDQETFMTRYYKFPHFVRQDNAELGTSMTTDGDKVWRVTSEGWRELTDSNWEYIPDIYSDFLDYRDRGIRYRLLGAEAIDEHVYYHLVKIHEDGEARDFYFSADTYLLRMERRDFGVGKDIKSYLDYRRHGDVLFPHLFVVTLDVGFGRIHGGVLKSLKVNDPLPVSLFRPE